MIYLVEITAAIDAAGTLQTFYVSSGAYQTSPADTPANINFVNALSDPGSLGLTVYNADGRSAGASALQLGSLALVNADGSFDSWIDYGFDGRPITIRLYQEGVPYALMPVLLTCTSDGVPAITRQTVTFRLRDKQQLLDLPACSNLYGGTNVLPAGVDGTAQDIKGQRKPRMHGVVLGVTPTCVNTSLEIYQVADAQLSDITAVYVNGAPYTKDADYATNALLQAATIAAGYFATCTNEGLFRLNDALSGQITADAIRGGQAVTNLMLQSQSLNAAAWTAYNSTVAADTTTAPDGTTTADTVTGTAVDSAQLQYFTPAVTTVQNYSVWLRCASGTQSINIYVIKSGGATVAGATCALTTSWQRFNLDFNALDLTQHYVTVGGGSSLGVGATVIAWGAQRTDGSGVKPYVPTTTAAVAKVVPAATAAGVMQAIALAAGLPSGSINAADVAALSAAQPTPVGIFASDDTTTYRDMIHQVAASVGAWAAFDNLGVLRMGRIVTPAGTPALTLSDSLCLDFERVETDSVDVPIFQLQLNHTKNWTTQTTGLAGSLSLARQQFLANAFRTWNVSDPTVQAKFLLANTLVVNSLLYDPTPIAGGPVDTEANRQLTLYKVKRNVWQATVHVQVLLDQGIVPTLMSLVQVQSSRLLTGGVGLFWVIGFDVELSKSQVILTLWG